MGGWWEAWTVGRSTAGRWLVLGVLLSSLPTFPLSAQVGHDPARSPYQDILQGNGLVFQFGYLIGDEGRAGVGLIKAAVFGARFDVRVSNVLRLSAGLAMARGERYIVDPDAPAATRKSGPVPDQALLLEGEGQMGLTGGKTWRSLAPYLVLSGGIGYGGEEPTAEPSGYRFGTKLYYGAGAGIRWFPVRRLALQADARLMTWKLSYPGQYFVAPTGSTPVLEIGQGQTERVRYPWIRVALGWTL
jgi:hypothetical protein